LELEIAVVKRFDDRAGKEYGFAAVLDVNGEETGETIFFHLGDGQFVEITKGRDDIEFIGPVFPNGLTMRSRTLNATKPGERIAFQRAKGKDDRPKACPWTIEESYTKRRKSIEDAPSTPVLKLVES
jgi:hypothetical protein